MMNAHTHSPLVNWPVKLVDYITTPLCSVLIDSTCNSSLTIESVSEKYLPMVVHIKSAHAVATLNFSYIKLILILLYRPIVTSQYHTLVDVI